MAKEKFSTHDLQLMAYEDHDRGVYEVIKDEITSHSRWSVGHVMIFKVLATGKYYSTYYSVGATEYQDEGPYEYGEDEECDEVVPVQKTVTVYEPVN